MMMVKKLYKENYLHKKKNVQETIYIKKINKKSNYYPPSPHFLFLFFALWK